MRLVTGEEQRDFNRYVASLLRTVACWLREPDVHTELEVASASAVLQIYFLNLVETVASRCKEPS